jgi:hypothetical protein
VRKRAHNVNEQFYGDEEINEIIDRYGVVAHIKSARPLSTPWTEADDIYEVVRTYVLLASACEILSSVEIGSDETRKACQEGADSALSLLVVGTDTAVVGAGYDLVNGLDEDHYGQQF